MIQSQRKWLLGKLPREIIKEINELAPLTGKSKFIIEQKTVLIKKLKDEHKLSLPEIGMLLHRNHTSILNLYHK